MEAHIGQASQPASQTPVTVCWTLDPAGGVGTNNAHWKYRSVLKIMLNKKVHKRAYRLLGIYEEASHGGYSWLDDDEVCAAKMYPIRGVRHHGAE